METNKTGKRMMHVDAHLRTQIKHVFWWMDGLLFYVAACLCLGIVFSFAFGVLRFAPWPVLQKLVTTQRVWMLLFLPVLIYFCFIIAGWCLNRCRNR